MPGADINPYYALSAIFALGMRGVEQKLTLPYGPVGHPDVSPATLPKLATDLGRATEKFGAAGSIAREVLGDDFVEHFKGTREHEWNLWQTAVTNFEVCPGRSDAGSFSLRCLLTCSSPSRPRRSSATLSWRRRREGWVTGRVPCARTRFVSLAQRRAVCRQIPTADHTYALCLDLRIAISLSASDGAECDR